ncbi:hypothetical protein IFM89_006315 [Coptis chinensis]|uniref:Uncharacterized protein n=1 Tax=Coptis chinensis TaxID=261450 RepID=A0A835I9R3_9MAGN|nr:hypothetical protein IFM89_006315 [Coptis chinensis]
METNKSNSMSSLYNKVVEKESMRGMVSNSRPIHIRSQFGATSAAATKKVMIRSKEVDINESAEAFINRFRQQLKIERLDSIENYKKYLERGL